MHPQSMSNQQQMAQLHLLASFHPLHRAPIDPGRVGEGLLGEVHVQPPHTDAIADSSAGIENPLGLIGWHPTNRLRIKIISQQQN